MSTDATPDDSPIAFDTYTPRVAIVTGAAQGIGYCIALKLADDGIDIAVNDIPAKTEQLETLVGELQKKGRRALSVPGDVSSEADVISLVEKTTAELGGVDIMVANAGLGTLGAFFETTVELLDTLYAVNVRGIFLCLKHAAAQMVKQRRGGRIIAASSILGRTGSPGAIAYSATKFAIRGLVQSASVELRKYGITINAYQPGFIKTPMLYEGAQIEAGRLTSVFFDANGKFPVGEPEDVAVVVSFFAKPESYFVNGQALLVDGGLRFN